MVYRIGPRLRQDWLYDHIVRDESLGYSTMLEMYEAKWKLKKSTFAKDWKIARERYLQRRDELVKVKDDIYIEQMESEIKRGLKSKFERLMQYQDLVDDCIKDLASGMTTDTYINREGMPKQYRRKMNIAEYNQTRRTVRDLQAEISKIEGDYAEMRATHQVTIHDEFSGKTLQELKVLEAKYSRIINRNAE